MWVYFIILRSGVMLHKKGQDGNVMWRVDYKGNRIFNIRAKNQETKVVEKLKYQAIRPEIKKIDLCNLKGKLELAIQTVK